MKRAVFKLGNSIRVHSTYSDRSKKSGLASFIVEINVLQWLDDPDPVWDFDIQDAEPAANPGVTIVVGDLHEETKSQFGSPDFIAQLHGVLERDYLLPVLRGLRVTLNDRGVAVREPLIRAGGLIRAMRSSYEDGAVRVEMFAGMAASPPDDAEPELESRADTSSGWYVLCNGRAVVSADRSELTGWGRTNSPMALAVRIDRIRAVFLERSGGAADYHHKAKPCVASPVYLRALARMREPTRTWIDYTNARKRDLDGAKKVEQSTKPVALTQVSSHKSLGLRAVKNPKSSPKVANVNPLLSSPECKL